MPKGGSFSDMVALKGYKEISDKMNAIIATLAEASDLKGVIDVADFNDADNLGKGKEMVDRLTDLASIFDNPALDFSADRAEGDALLGDAFEFLMRHFAAELGKSKGRFYIPTEVSRVLAKVVVGGDVLTPRTERRAENVHALWAAQCFPDIWSIGPQRDDARKQHPWLEGAFESHHSRECANSIMASS